MARYRAEVHSPMTPAEAFEAMAHLERFSEWDPGVRRARQTVGDGPGAGSAYELVVRSGPRDLPMTYRVTEFDAGRRYVAIAETSTLRSVDTVTVEKAPGGSTVVYDAKLDLRGLLRIFDPALSLVFGRIGDRAAAGLRRFLGAA